jgi:hypothetical protein
MERCIFCQGDLEPVTWCCRQCGRTQPERQVNRATGAVQEKLFTHCRACGEILPIQARFCGRCGQVLSSSPNLAPDCFRDELNQASLTLEVRGRPQVAQGVVPPSEKAHLPISRREKSEANNGHVFISYSRKQFYFTESLVLSLQRLGVATWFDVQQLVPGSSWQQSLEEGLDSCNGLVLIVSRAALTSDYIRAEWQAALRAEKPIYVVLFEAVELPPELQNASIFDCRSDFDAKIELLAESIRMRRVYRDPLQLPRPLPLSLWWVIVAFWSQAVSFTVLLVRLLLKLLYSAAFDVPVIVVFAVISAATVFYLAFFTYYLAIGFTYRRKIPYPRVVLLVTPLYLFLPYYLASSCGWEHFVRTFGIPLQCSDEIFVSFFLFIVIPSLLGVSAFFVMPHSRDVCRWLATGTAPETLRRSDANQQLRLTSALGQESLGRAVKTYRLHYDPADEHLASEVRSALQSRRSLCPSASEEADIHIAILTNRTQQTWIKELMQAYDGLVCIVATSIRIPLDEAKLRQIQWVDYRTRTSRELERMAFLLSEGTQAGNEYNYPVVPESLETILVPVQVRSFGYILRTLASFNLAFGGAAALLIAYGGIGGSALGMLPIGGILIGLYLFWLDDRLMTASIPYKVFMVAVVVAQIGMFIVGTPQFFLLLFNQFFGPVLALMWLILPLLRLWYIHRDMRKWLPEGKWPQLHGRRDLTLTLPAWKQSLPSRAVYVFLSVQSGAVFMTVVMMKAAAGLL